MKALKEVPRGEDDGFLRCVGGMMPSFLECFLVSGISPIIADLPDGPLWEDIIPISELMRLTMREVT